MANASFTLRNDLSELNHEKIGRFDAFFPEVDSAGNKVSQDEIPPYIRINDLVFKTKYNGGNYSIFIAPGNLDAIPKTAPLPVSWEPASKADFFFFRIKKDKTQKWMFIGLVLALTGVAIDAAFVIGKVHIFIECSETFMIILLAIAMGLKIIGLLIAFFKGFWEG